MWMFKRIFLYFLSASTAIQISTAQLKDTLLFENINLIPMTSDTVIPQQRVIIAGGKIVNIENSILPTKYTGTIID